MGILHLFHLRKGSNYFLTSKSASPISQLRGFSRGFFVPLYTDADEAVIQSFHSRANRSRFPIRSQKKEEIRARKGTSIRRVNESARITCPTTRSRFFAFSFIPPLLSRHPLDLRCVCPSRPTVRVFSAREAESVAINSPLALTVDAGHDIRNVARIQCFRALDGNRRFHPCRVDESVAEEKPVSRADSLFASPTKP